ncbi:hypothetical protein SAMN02745190_02424 [Schwartzia succinivorans DSM 10502]|jgi:hypothetical protein|uniref:Uncharacterized protein n=1 Tax=Schwartzia succinivorans DSM 10502 TaxID=1123243 RepID=A0A1M5ATB2_9FIRM|nr:hypothetical protein SAMN02745190_02424 [Schwartzia succinivorans DSM 10502]
MFDSSVQDAICGFIDSSYAAVVEKEKKAKLEKNKIEQNRTLTKHVL